jgi:lambda family phage tail tape measure protein
VVAGARRAVVEIASVARIIDQLVRLTNPATAIGVVLESARGLTPAQTVASRFPREDERFGRLDRGSVDKEIQRAQLGREAQYIGIIGQLASVQQIVRAQEIAITQARLAGVPVTQRQEAAILRFTEAQALGVIQIRQQTEAMRIEAATIGMGVGQAAAYRAEQERLADFRIRGIALTERQAAAIRAEAQALGAATQAAAQKSLADQVTFERQQLFRSDSEQQVASRLRQVYDVGYTSHLDDPVAQAMRLNAVMGDIKDVASTAFHGIAADLRAGASAGEALMNVLNRGIDRFLTKLEDQAFNMLFGGLFGGGGGSLFGSLLGFGGAGASDLAALNAGFLGFDRGGFTGRGGRHEPAGVVHRGEYVFDAASTAAIGVGNLEALRLAARHAGYADGGAVGGALPAIAAGSTQPIRIELDLHVHADGSVEAVARQAAAQEATRAVNVRVNTFSMRELPDRLIQIQKNPHKRG